MLRAVTLDYWDTLYLGSALPERKMLRYSALRGMLQQFGRDLSEPEFAALYRASGEQAERWWRDEQRGYTAGDRIRWLLERLDIQRPSDCEHVARAVAAVDEALLQHPPPLLDGAADFVRRLADRFVLGIVSDTGFASGRAQDGLLEKDQLLEYFTVRIYSCDVGHAKPRREPFEAAVRALGISASEIVHIGDIERTDVCGALEAGLRAIRLDLVRKAGPSSAEFVAGSFGDILEYLAC